MDQAVYAAKVHEHAVRGDVLDSTFQYLAFFQLGHDFGLLLFDFVFDKSLVRNHHVLVFVVDLDNLEFHRLVDEHIVVADGLHIDLRTWQECFQPEHIDDQAAFGTALDITGDDFLVVVSFVDTFPGFEDTGFLMREDQLAGSVFLAFHIDFHLVARLEVGVVAEFGNGDDTVGFVTDVDHHFAVVLRNDGPFDDFLIGNLLEGVAILFVHRILRTFLFGVFFFFFDFVVFEFVPVEVLDTGFG